MLTWRQGTHILSEVSKKDEVSLADFITMIAKSSIARASGTAVFLTGNPDATPTALLHNIQTQQGIAREQHHPESDY
jgi:KUP system potassium uptake protein